jgi:hypothetical protein
MKIPQLWALPTLALLINLTGCQFATLFLPDPHGRIKAEYKLPPKQRYAIFIDDYMAPMGSPEAKMTLAETIGNYLVDGKALRHVDLVEPKKIYDQPTESPEGKKYSIQHIGAEVGADYVIYVNVIEFNLQADEENPLVQPKARAYVKLIEVSTGERLWPVDLAGFPIDVKERMSGEMFAEADKGEWSNKLSQKIAVEAAQIFFEHSAGG